MTTFNILLPEKFSKGASGGSRWNTEVNVNEGGARKANVNWDFSHGRWNISHLVKTPQQLAELRNVFNVVQGRAFLFLFKDWKDYLANHYELPTGHLPVIGEGDGAATQFQLYKTYAWFHKGQAQAGGAASITLAASQDDWPDHAVDDTYNGRYVRITGGTGDGQVAKITDYVGATKVATVAPAWATPPDATSTYAIETYRQQRPINRLTPGTAQLYVDGVLDGAATFDVTTGVATPSSTPASGAILTADFEFYNIVAFETDLENSRFDTINTRSWPGIVLAEELPVEHV